ncbi:MAG: NAD(P)/FAD-dependent oxidoreductase [Bacteriovoracaceae bacterium]|nr:NAD(P)/FAD-dependent oxidoreductase [Bacteriovoracaceae bacterium]
MISYDVLIIGAGTAGITTAARLQKKNHFKTVAIIDPSSTHAYQPLWTLVGAGLVDKKITLKPMSEVIPKGVTWIKESVQSIDSDAQNVKTDKGLYSYKYLIVATGIVADWTFAEGLKENIGKNNIASVYSYETADYCFDVLKGLSEGNLIFTMPLGLLKCGGAPQKIMWLSEDFCTRFKKRDQFKFHFSKEGAGIFGIEKYKLVLDQLVSERNIHTHYHENLVKVDGVNRIAYFKNLETGVETQMSYGLLHVTPHFKTHDFIASNKLANKNGEIDVDPHTLQSIHHPNVFSLGDCSSCPTGKTGAGIRKQAPVLVENLINFDKKLPITKKYDGYTACPILTRHNRVILAEFDYKGNPVESFPFNQAQESYLMFIFKRYLLPLIYWRLMLKGRA